MNNPEIENISKNRREFLIFSSKAAGVLSFAGLTSFLSSCEEFSAYDIPETGQTIELDITEKKNINLNFTGKGIMRNFGNANYGIAVIVVKQSEGIYKAYSSMCTHNNCYGRDDNGSWENSMVRPPLGPSEDSRAIVCQCHGSRFDPFKEGIPTQGPAEKPLRKFRCSFDAPNKKVTVYF